MNLKIRILLAVICFYNIVIAQNEITLDPVTLTATISPQKISRTGRNVFVIDGKEFNNLPVHSIDDLLRYLPGVEVQMRGPMGAQSDIILRGGTFQQSLIILDGLRLNDPNSGHFSSYIPITPSEINRIEILKGASSAIYGSEAVGGVIQIFSKSFVAKYNQKLKELFSSVTTGQYNLINANAGGTISNKKNILSAGILTNNAMGQQQRGTTGYFYNHTASLSATHFFNENLKISLRSSFDSRKFSAQNFYTTFTSDTAKEKVQTFWNQLRISYQKGKNKFSLNAGYKEVQDEYAFNAAISANKNRSALLQSTATFEREISEKTDLITGFQFQNKNIISNDRGNHTVQQAAGFVLLNHHFGNLYIAPALRLHYENTFELVPQINLSYKIRNLQIRGSAGKTLREADFTERYNNYNKTFVQSGSIGNPDLQPERSFNYEVGTDFFGKNIKLSGTIFRREQTNVIDWTPTPYNSMPRNVNLSPTGNYALAGNIAKVNVTGIETDFQYHKGNFLSTVGLVWLDDKINETVPSFYISSHAKLLVNFNLQYQNKLGAINLNGIYKDRNMQSDYFLLNAKMDINILKNKFALFVEADNVFNKMYSDLLGSLMPGRWVMAGARILLR